VINDNDNDNGNNEIMASHKRKGGSIDNFMIRNKHYESYC